MIDADTPVITLADIEARIAKLQDDERAKKKQVRVIQQEIEAKRPELYALVALKKEMMGRAATPAQDAEEES